MLKTSSPKVIAIDQGNRSIKTVNYSFIAGFERSGNTFGVKNDDILTYEGKTYVLSENGRIPQRTDKTADEDYFILSLFAIGKELLYTSSKTTEINSLQSYPRNKKGAIEIVLLIGTPPGQYQTLASKYVQYFKDKGQISFNLGGMSICVEVVEVQAYPQAYAGAIAEQKQFSSLDVVNVVDIGGGTADCMRLLENLKIDTSVLKSLEGKDVGVNALFNQINDKARTLGAKNIPDTTIEGILRNNPIHLENASTERKSLIYDETMDYVAKMLKIIEEQAGIDFREDTTLFIGGGALLLKRYIEEINLVNRPIFTSSDRINAIGYELIYNLSINNEDEEITEAPSTLEAQKMPVSPEVSIVDTAKEISNINDVSKAKK